ncbi:hypothetical protein HYG86_16240 [Alkalicella caledoniensis]|uniref:DUF2229 domain-containing protein n=1 Tax=Alkalicella caledoniensis TaxID=2731377 RepID=A0A7G9WC00_ALKCA|nr:acyl-CoA dehydratase activase-related protein [Alkalicella caledoniensis]QNO16212.1 hypothetical protein HYG86_16240 [Alkalicella caledoniensis]
MFKVSIGIPRALLYYDFLPHVDTFFKALGVEVIISPPTTKKIIEKGNQLSIDEACLPVKVCMGHLAYFEDTKVDGVFLPRVISIEKNKFICPKFLGLPDYAKGALKGKINIFSPDIKISSLKEFTDSLTYFSKELSIPKKNVITALKEVNKSYGRYKDKLTSGTNLIDFIDKKNSPKKDLKIALLGHGYNIYDKGINLDIFDKMTECAEVKTIEMYTEKELAMGRQELPKPLFWTYGEKILAAALYSLKYSDVDGIVVVTAFGCGPDSFITELIGQAQRNYTKTPLMTLTLDEHSAEAGLVTRLEAFTDLLTLRRKKLWA